MILDGGQSSGPETETEIETETNVGVQSVTANPILRDSVGPTGLNEDDASTVSGLCLGSGLGLGFGFRVRV